MKILVIGAGSIGRRHRENLQALGVSAELIGWRATSPEALALRLGSGAVQGVVIATATQIRLPLIAVCARADVPFYVEKPLAFRLSDLAQITVIAAPVADRSLVGYMMRYHPAFRDLAQADLSDTFRFDLAIGHDVTQWRANWLFSQSYAAKPDGGGVLLDLCHELDMAACLFPGLRIDGVTSLGHTAYPGVDMASRVTLSAPNGASGTVAMDYLAPALIRRVTICGTRASRDYDFAAQSYRVTDGNGPRTLPHPLERNAMFLDAMRDFLALIAGRAPSGIDHLPRLDRVGESCALIAQAWQDRRFTGQITKDIA
ncbi:MAG: Gfo/Idh/MocA family oxidoreductase [Paracoccaceae bacterium]|nr:Gfo/Idh/MocA family oxidoreductase [Paracoccaceae bacterium]